MATTYGYTQPRFGAYARSPGLAPAGAQRYTGALASALAGGSPLRANTTGYGGYAGYQALNPLPANAPPPPPPRVQGAAAPQNRPITPQNQAPAQGVYDLNTDPVLQQITAFTGQSDQQAQSSALRQRQQLLLGYGDQGLAQQVLGAGDPTAQAAGQNLASILAQLGQQHTQMQTNYENALDPNLFYSTARVQGEQQLAQDYQNALGNAAGQVQGGLDTISNNLASQLASNQQQRIQAANEAYQRQLDAAAQAAALAASQAPAGAGGYAPGPASAGVSYQDPYSVANAVQAQAIPPEQLLQYVDPNTAAGRYALSVLQQQSALSGTRSRAY